MAKPRIPLATATFRAIAHATEDVDRVRQTIRALAGDEVSLEETRSRGFHHQPLRVIEGELKGSRKLRDLVRKLATEEIVADYSRTWERRLDDEEGIVHFRLAKQPLLEDKVELEPEGGEGDLIKLELKLLAYPAKSESYRKVARELFELGKA
jgi:RNA binding exosome subunit